METVSKKKKKAGRPPKAIKREIRVCIRFTRSEYFIIREKAAGAGLKASALIRQAAIQARINSRLTDEERHFVRQLIGMANNLNQLAKNCHQEGVPRAMLYFEGYRKHLDELLKKLHHDK
ncbi:MAG TPA: plasmid mobilization relaxosome protein MobC [Chitinophagaceae bacterium]